MIYSPFDSGEGALPYYRLYHVRNDHFAGVDEFQAADDAEAIRHAETLGGSSTAELWSGKRKVKLFKARQGGRQDA